MRVLGQVGISDDIFFFPDANHFSLAQIDLLGCLMFGTGGEEKTQYQKDDNGPTFSDLIPERYRISVHG
jgi:hypothetical protein